MSNEIIKKSKMIKPIVRIRLTHQGEILRSPKPILSVNDFYFYCCDLDKVDADILTQHNIKGSQKGMVLMSIDYPNEPGEFRNNNRAYVIIDPDNIEDVMKAIAPEKYNNRDKFKACSLKICNSCMELSKPCRNKNVSLNINKKMSGEEHGALQTIKLEQKVLLQRM